MGIIAIVTAITIPTINSYLPYWKLNTSTRMVVQKLRQAQEEAVTTQIRHGVKFDTGATPPTLAFVKDGGANPDETLETVTLSKGITLALASAIINNTPADEQNSIFFSPDGGPDVGGPDVNITVTLDGSTKTVNVSPAGVIKVQQ